MPISSLRIYFQEYRNPAATRGSGETSISGKSKSGLENRLREQDEATKRVLEDREAKGKPKRKRFTIDDI
jgi:hypothetical protein